MKYLKVFETDADQQNYINGEFDRPNITIVRHQKQSINYIPNIIDDDENNESNLTFPITLVEGDNGDLGKNFYRFVWEQGHNNEEVYAIRNGYVIQTYDWYAAIEGFPITSAEWEVVDATNGIGSPSYDYSELSEAGYLKFIKVIVFTVFGTEYQAEEGMTWEEFANSKYSNGEFVCAEWEVSCNNRSVCKQYGAVYVMPSDIIMENYNYVQYSTGGSN